eukprot:gene34323-44341_t
MLAASYTNIGSPADILSFGIVDKPTPKDDQVLIKVSFASINPVDVLVARGYLSGAGWLTPSPFIPGYDVSGIVDGVGKDVTDFKVGDRVAAVNWGVGKHDQEDQPTGGAFAEYVAWPSHKVSLVPDTVSLEDAAAVPLVGTTAWQGLLVHGQVKAGSKVLILGGSSAVGNIAIQLAKNAGAWVATTTSTRAEEFTQQWGPDLIINYEKEKWYESSSLRDIDLVFDTVGEVGGFANATGSAGLLKANGAFVSIANQEAGYDPKGHPPLTFAAFFGLWNSREVQDGLLDLIAKGKLRIVIDSKFPFTAEGVKSIFDKVEGKKSLGKNILVIP